jgi:hypothetical protein
MFQSKPGPKPSRRSLPARFSKAQAGGSPHPFYAFSPGMKRKIPRSAKVWINPSFRSYTRIWKTAEKPKREEPQELEEANPL